MYRFLFIIIFITILTNYSYSQPLQDGVWILGATSNSTGVLLDFSSGTLDANLIEKEMWMFSANASIADSMGSLRFYTNGCHINNYEHQLIENGDSLNPSLFASWCRGSSGSPFIQSVLALPWPGKPEQYALFHLSDYGHVINFDSLELSTGTFHKLSLTEIDMRLNQGLGAVVRKRQQVFWDTLAHGYLQAVRHANGKDWWLLVPELRVGEGTNCYYRLLFTRYGIVESGKQCLGQKWDIFDAAGQCAFSPDGTRYVRFQGGSQGYFSGLFLFDFDRCTAVRACCPTIKSSTTPIQLSVQVLAFPPTTAFCMLTMGPRLINMTCINPIAVQVGC